MLPRTSKRALIALVSVFLAAMALPASADFDDPPEFRFPQEPEDTIFHSSFGAARSGGRRHKGNDLMAPKMTEVYALADGVVTTVRTAGMGGRYIGIDHGDGWESFYMHLNNDTPGTDNGRADWSHTVAPGVEVGSFVKAGQLIGWVGDSGNAEWTGPHTHFEIHYGGRAINPYPFLIQAWNTDIVERRLSELMETLDDTLELLESVPYDTR